MTGISVIVRATDDTADLAACLESIAVASSSLRSTVEAVVVVDGRCGGSVVRVAEQGGARVVRHDGASSGAARNLGVSRSTGSLIVVLDADGRLHRRSLVEVERHLGGGRCVGGAASVVSARHSLGIDLTMALVRLTERVSGLGGGMYWCTRRDFDEVEGFNEHLVRASGADFARRLREHGRHSGRRFVNLRATPVTTSCSAFDRFGDWHMLGGFRRDAGQRLSGTETVGSSLTLL